MIRDNVHGLFFFLPFSSFGYYSWATYIAYMFAKIPDFTYWLDFGVWRWLAWFYIIPHFKRRLVLDIVCENTD